MWKHRDLLSGEPKYRQVQTLLLGTATCGNSYTHARTKGHGKAIAALPVLAKNLKLSRDLKQQNAEIKYITFI